MSRKTFSHIQLAGNGFIVQDGFCNLGNMNDNDYIACMVVVGYVFKDVDFGCKGSGNRAAKKSIVCQRNANITFNFNLKSAGTSIS